MRQNFPILSAILDLSAGAPDPNKPNERQMSKDEDCKNRVLYAGGGAGLHFAAARDRAGGGIGRGDAGGRGRLRAHAGTSDLRLLSGDGTPSAGQQFHAHL